MFFKLSPDIELDSRQTLEPNNGPPNPALSVEPANSGGYLARTETSSRARQQYSMAHTDT